MILIVFETAHTVKDWAESGHFSLFQWVFDELLPSLTVDYNCCENFFKLENTINRCCIEPILNEP